MNAARIHGFYLCRSVPASNGDACHEPESAHFAPVTWELFSLVADGTHTMDEWGRIVRADRSSVGAPTAPRQTEEPG